jgi:ankyrin repeat protein
MFQACLDQKIDDVKRQIIAGSSPNLYNDTIFWERGWTPIRYAALVGSKLDKSDIHKYQMNMAKKIIGLLINAGADINSQDACGTTTLMSVSQFDRRKELVLYLISMGARLDIKDNYNRMAYDYANTENMKSILK